MIKETSIDRRSFLPITIWTIGGLVSLGIGIPAIVCIIGPALKSNKAQNWTQLGSVSKVELDTPTLFNTRVERKTGWIVDEEKL